MLGRCHSNWTPETFRAPLSHVLDVCRRYPGPPTPWSLATPGSCDSMLPALSYQVAGQLSPVILAAARSWTGSSLFRRSYAEAAGATIQEVKTAQDYDAIMKHLAETGTCGIIDFTAKWCGPCKAIAPIYEELSQKYPQVKFLKVDIDNQDLQEIVNDHGITGVPTFTMYKGPRKVENFTGARVDLLRSVLQKHAS